jgi:hypothetical protein
MIELRWLVKNGWDGPERVLQYRQQYDKTVYAGLGQFPESAKQIGWSEWLDVTTIDNSETDKSVGW